MGNLDDPQGLFDLHNSDVCVGSMLSKSDVVEILGVEESDLHAVTFKPLKEWNGIEAVDERVLRKAWKKKEIPNSPSPSGVSLDEKILEKLVNIAYPGAAVDPQWRCGDMRVDFRVTVGETSKLIEYDGPEHFVRKQPSDKHPLTRKRAIESGSDGEECVIWPYWIQLCEKNVRAIFDESVNGLGALWSTKNKNLFGHFVFPDSAHVIEVIGDRFHARRGGGWGYFYGPNTENRKNPEHPVIGQIRRKPELVKLLLPPGYDNIEKWVPRCLVG